jgi:SAM-dependent methyltransferase
VNEVRRNWDELARLFSTVAPAPGDTFSQGRLEEGRQIGGWLLDRHPDRRPLRILDIGADNGGVVLGAANYVGNDVHSIDINPNPQLLALRQASGFPMYPVVAVGERLPFRDETFDVVVCLETIEHVPTPKLLGPEIMRVLRRGGECMITTPARLRYVFARDPHYGLPGLLLLPDRLQKLVAERFVDTYDVVHIFWSVDEVVRCFPGATSHEAFFHRKYGDSEWRDALWWRWRHLLWDRIVITK